ncbi:MAG: NUDIX domain-containing protein [bacterium]|nr:NUDIX domain-containing protein [bacterium]
MRHNISSRGILEKDGKILFIEYIDSQGILYALPGGSQEAGEDLRSTAAREFKEETDLDITTHEVMLVREFIISKSEFDQWKNGIHQVEIIFRCSQNKKDQEAKLGLICDGGMYNIKWIPKDEIKNYRIYPSRDLVKIIEEKSITYLFDKE